jgi:POT family proton-dependent oligopeptide transporter
MTAQSPAADAPETGAKTRTFLGHPWGLAYLFGTELWERFAFYGILAFFVLYMVNHLFTPGHVEHILFYGAVKSGFESIFGPLSPQAFASQIYGLYLGTVYLAPFFGGILADRVLGQRRAVAIGAALLAIGYLLMSFESLFFVAFPAIIIGNGCFKPNISTQVGNLYPAGDHRRDRAFSIFYVGINIGGFLAPAICGPVAERVGWNYGFLLASLGMVLALVIYLFGQRSLPQDALTQAKAARTVHAALTRQEWMSIWAFLGIVILCVFFWAAWYQQFDTINLWTDQNTDRDISIFGWRFNMPTTSFQTLNGAFIFVLTPFVNWLWVKQAKRNQEPASARKMGIGCILLGLSFLLMLGAVAQTGSAGKASWAWLLGFYAIYTAGELYLSPVGLSLVTKIAPPRMVSMLMGVWFLPNFMGGIAAGWLGSFWEILSKSQFFLLMAALSIGAGIVFVLLDRRLKTMIIE